MRRVVLVIPFIFTLVSLLQLNYIASVVVSPDQILRPLLVLWALLCLLIWPAFLLTHDWNGTALLLTILALGLFSSASLFFIVLAFVAVVGSGYLVFVRIKRVPVHYLDFLHLLSGTGFLSLGYVLVLMTLALARIPWAEYRLATQSARLYSPDDLSSPAIKRDIYYIVLDGYARSDILQDFFQFDNSSFVTELEGMGFIVPVSSHSNYPATPLSIASTLNMEYIQTLVPALHDNSQRWLMAPFIDHSRVRSVLEQQGYRTVSMSTNWTITDNATTDTYLHPYPVMLTDFEGYIFDVTPLHLFEPLLQDLIAVPTAESHRRIVRHSFETLADIPEIEGPKFVFIHIISPHPPFVFDSEGNPVDAHGSFTFQDANEFPGVTQEYSRKYIEQLQFVNDQVGTVIGAILARSADQPIIIVQADHGSGLLTDLTSSENTCMRERFSPFAAYHLPGMDGGVIPPDISAVNLFRIVLDEYFDADLPMLEDRQYFYKSPQVYYDFDDVTGKMNDECRVPGE